MRKFPIIFVKKFKKHIYENHIQLYFGNQFSNSIFYANKRKYERKKQLRDKITNF